MDAPDLRELLRASIVSKVLYIVIFYSKYTRTPTLQNFQARSHVVQLRADFFLFLFIFLIFFQARNRGAATAPARRRLESAILGASTSASLGS